MAILLSPEAFSQFIERSFIVKKSILLLILVCAATASAQWSELQQLQYANIHCILTTSSNAVFIGGQMGLFIRSTDGGSTWTNVGGHGFWPDTILSLAEGLGYVFAGANGVESVYRSTDNGDTWSAANNGLPPVASINGICTAGNTLYAATDRGIYSSADSGGHWKADTAGLSMGEFYPGLNRGTVGIALAGSNLYTMKQYWGSVYTSPTDSISWMKIAADTLQSGYAIAAVDTYVFFATQKGIYLYDESGGAWHARNNGLPVNDSTWLISCLLTSSDSLLFAYLGASSSHSYVQELYVTSDLGQTWTHVNDTVFSSASVTTMAASRDFLFIGTAMGGWRIPVADVVTSVRDVSSPAPTGYALSQNYPNPFNPATTIQFSTAKSSVVNLKILDLLGREVARLVNEQRPAGTYSVMWNAGNLPSGVYFYQLRAGSFVETKKLLLLK
jgi:photosystem II stability/assembly factor-like uncharacterized protein